MTNLFQKKNLFALICLGIALLAFTFAIITFASDRSYATGSIEISKSYGGDAYTGIQNAAAQTATNTYYTNRNLKLLTNCIANFGGFAFILVSLTFALIGLKELGMFEEKKCTCTCTCSHEETSETDAPQE